MRGHVGYARSFWRTLLVRREIIFICREYKMKKNSKYKEKLTRMLKLLESIH